MPWRKSGKWRLLRLALRWARKVREMSEALSEISDDVAEFIRSQRMFFVATAPSSLDGHLNLSPKGLDTFSILDPTRVAYLDLTGSGVETVAHLKENGRVVVMFCAFTGEPKIVRIHGRGEVSEPGMEDFDDLCALFPPYQGTRSVIKIEVTRVSTSCGWGVPNYEFGDDREMLLDWAGDKGPEGIAAYQRAKNRRSVDGLPGLR